ncbi:MAG: hypothetical protein H6830_07775 [Planctomycetes bacterium]|nr:hypothetical protein [Planctomycetota bacterium]MCB9910298.1 hypothetical protein [Planctomycetota bacterium]HPF15304.1 hypothetical protein [Planctomycetota bacterium]HRV81110.1 hypothetical protein [Planctomycetota bacterium]
MAKKGARRIRRSPEELIADLKKKIEEVEQRAAAKELKQSGSIKRTLGIVRNIDKALEEAQEEGLTKLRHALAEARGPIEGFLSERGVKLPKARVPRGRKPKKG